MRPEVKQFMRRPTRTIGDLLQQYPDTTLHELEEIAAEWFDPSGEEIKSVGLEAFIALCVGSIRDSLRQEIQKGIKSEDDKVEIGLIEEIDRLAEARRKEIYNTQ
jgi:hypothetical protein